MDVTEEQKRGLREQIEVDKRAKEACMKRNDVTGALRLQAHIDYCEEKLGQE